MSDTVRFGISLSLELLDRFDELLRALGYASRSEAVRDLIRAKLAEEDWQSPESEATATVTLLYEAGQGGLTGRLVELAGQAQAQVLGSTRVPLDGECCVETFVLHGEADDVRELADHMISLKGVRHGALQMVDARHGG